MSVPLWFWSHLSTGVVLASLLLLMAGRRSLPAQIVIVVLAMLCVHLPVGQTDLTGLILAYTEVLSVSTIVTLVYFVVNHSLVQHNASNLFGHQFTTDRIQVLSCSVVFVLAGTALYASALGFIHFDLYAVGFRSGFTWSVLGVAGVLAVKLYWLPAFCLVLSVVGHQCSVAESPNLWNYLLDPWLVVICGCQLIVILLPQLSALWEVVDKTENCEAASGQVKRVS